MVAERHRGGLAALFSFWNCSLRLGRSRRAVETVWGCGRHGVRASPRASHDHEHAVSMRVHGLGAARADSFVGRERIPGDGLLVPSGPGTVGEKAEGGRAWKAAQKT